MNRNEMIIEADELMGRLDDPSVRIFDVTIDFFRKEGEPTAHEKYMAQHIPGAAFLDQARLSEPTNPTWYMVLPENELATQIGQLGIANDSLVVVYANDLLPCATRAWWVLRYAGHSHVRVLNGGLTAWKAAGGQVESGERPYPATTFTPHLRRQMFASKEEVMAAMADGQVCTVNTLTPEMYDQAHIEGSSLRPCMNLMTEMRTLLPNESIAETLAEETAYDRVITYCGGGIAATVNGMAHLLAGNPNVSVYDGSMNEWLAEEMPTVRG